MNELIVLLNYITYDIYNCELHRDIKQDNYEMYSNATVVLIYYQMMMFVKKIEKFRAA